MTPLMNPSTYEFALWFVVVASGSLIIWQAVAFFSSRVPDHILPLVRRLSGDHEAVAVAYAWTLWLGLLSVVTFVAAGLVLGWLHFTRKRPA